MEKYKFAAKFRKEWFVHAMARTDYNNNADNAHLIPLLSFN